MMPDYGVEVLPDYEGGSMVNLMASIIRSQGIDSIYKPLEALPPSMLKSKRTVLVVVDGLGYNYLMKNGPGTVLAENLVCSATSVFPPTTATAITTFATGVAPQQHAVTGWHVFLKELGLVATMLPYKPRVGGPSIEVVSIGDVIEAGPISREFGVPCSTVIQSDLVGSAYTTYTSEGSTKYGFTTLRGFFTQLAKASLSSKKSYVYGYWSMLDSLNHEFGSKSPESRAHFERIAQGFERFVERMEGTGTRILVTSDHGFVDTPEKRNIQLKDHPELEECLVLPLCGDSRTKYCYVRPSMAKQFESYVERELSHACALHRSKELVKQGYFGLFKPSSKLLDRVGDYTLLMKENYCLRDSLLGQELKYEAGNHSGLTKDEMLVPVCLFDT